MLVLIEVTAKERMALWYEKEGGWKKTRAVLVPRGGIAAAAAALFEEIGEPVTAATGIGVLIRSGRFTTIRLAATVANTLAFALQAPLAEVSSRCSLKDLRSVLAKTPLGRYILPAYPAPPRLGGSKIH